MCRVQENERGRQGLAWFKMIVLCRDSFHLGRRFPITKAHGQFCDTSLWSLCFACGDILGVVLVEPWGDEWQDLIRYKLNVNGVYTPANHHLLWRRHNGAYYDLFGLRSSHGFASGVLSHRSGLLCLYFLHVHFFHCRSGKVPHIFGIVAKLFHECHAQNLVLPQKLMICFCGTTNIELWRKSESNLAELMENRYVLIHITFFLPLLVCFGPLLH